MREGKPHELLIARSALPSPGLQFFPCLCRERAEGLAVKLEGGGGGVSVPELGWECSALKLSISLSCRARHSCCRAECAAFSSLKYSLLSVNRTREINDFSQLNVLKIHPGLAYHLSWGGESSGKIKEWTASGKWTLHI